MMPKKSVPRRQAVVPSAVINEAIVFITAAAMVVLVRRVSREKLKESFRYFTVLSNVFCAFTALILLLSGSS